MNVFEVVFGILRKKNNPDRELAELMKLLDRLVVYHLDIPTSFKSAEIACQLTFKGMEIESEDCLIGGIFLVNGCTTIITRDKEHFQRIKGIKILGY